MDTLDRFRAMLSDFEDASVALGMLIEKTVNPYDLEDEIFLSDREVHYLGKRLVDYFEESLDSARPAVEEQTMDQDTTYSAIEKLSPKKGDIVFIRADSDSIDADSARRLRKALGAEGFAGLLIVGTQDVSIELLDEEKMKKYGWVKHDLRG